MRVLCDMNPPPVGGGAGPAIPIELASASAAAASASADDDAGASAGKAEAVSAVSAVADDAIAAVNEPCAIVITSVYSNGAIEGRVLRGTVSIGARLRTVLDTESVVLARAGAGLRGGAHAAAAAAVVSAGAAEAVNDGCFVVNEIALTGRRVSSAATGAFVGLRLQPPMGARAAALSAGEMLVAAPGNDASVGAVASAGSSSCSNAPAFRLRSGADEQHQSAGNGKNSKAGSPAVVEHGVAMVDTFEARITLMGVAPPAHGIPDDDAAQQHPPGTVKIGWSPILCAFGARVAVQLTHIIHELDARTGAVVNAAAGASPIQARVSDAVNCNLHAYRTLSSYHAYVEVT